MGLENRLKEYRARLNLNQSELGKLAQIFEVSVEDIFIYQEDEDNDEK